KDFYLILYINKLLVYTYKVKLFTKLDIYIIFNKIYIDSNSKKYTTFYTYYKIYKLKILSFRLYNSSTIY
ncbi:hypothetical protein COCMIDRAFT_111501, partial [Bipolaris oryzae ATCC 44560]